MNKTFGLLFYVKRSKIDDSGKAPIYLRITVDGQRTELSVKRDIEPERWNTEGGKVKGTTEEVKSINAYIDVVRAKIYDHHQKLIQENKVITADAIKNSFLGVDEKQKSLISIFTYHNKQMKALIGKEYAAGTMERYETMLRLLKLFLQWRSKADDVTLREVDHKFITDLEFWLKTERNTAHNTTMKYINNFKKIVRIALANGWIDRDPFINFKGRLKEVERGFLTADEIQAVISKDLHTHRLDQVRDIFVFCCFTGLAYADVQKLSKADITKGIDGEQWIQTHRRKTETLSSIPILPTALAILDKYVNHPVCVTKGKLLPVLTNQKMNGYLKEIADLCGITKNLTTHLARHTFATTITLTNGVPLESVSRMLGHKNIRTTQHYAKIIDRKVSDDMMILRNKLENGNTLKVVSSPAFREKTA